MEIPPPRAGEVVKRRRGSARLRSHANSAAAAADSKTSRIELSIWKTTRWRQGGKAGAGPYRSCHRSRPSIVLLADLRGSGMATTAHHGLRTPARRPESFHTAARAEHRDETGGGLSPAALVLIAAA